MTYIIGIFFGGSSSEHSESIRAAKILYEHAIKNKLDTKYEFEYFYVDRNNKWAGPRQSFRILTNSQSEECDRYDRILDLKNVDCIYSCCMGTFGENGNIQGLSDLLNIPIIGCGILASSLCLDKHLSKLLAERINIPTVEYLYVHRSDDVNELVGDIEEQIKFPCFVKPVNLGTCAYVFRANNAKEFISKWKDTIEKNFRSSTYLIEKFVPNREIRVFIYEDINGKLHTNDQYVTELREKALQNGGGLFDHLDNNCSDEVRAEIKKYATRLFRVFGMKDYARIDFFVDTRNNRVYFNESNTQPFLSSYNIKLMKKDGYSYSYFLDTMIRRNLNI
jgi:D-alanine-D-alanine ligase